VREKEVREAEIWPRRDGGDVEGREARVSRSARMEEDCLRAELKVVFYGMVVSFDSDKRFGGICHREFVPLRDLDCEVVVEGKQIGS
jgi:hypothetical protein